MSMYIGEALAGDGNEVAHIDLLIGGKQGPVENPPLILGWDASGVVEAIGSEVTLFQPGDEVYYAGDITRSGSNAEGVIALTMGAKRARLVRAITRPPNDRNPVVTPLGEIVASSSPPTSTSTGSDPLWPASAST